MLGLLTLGPSYNLGGASSVPRTVERASTPTMQGPPVKKLTYGDDARNALIAGVDTVANAVKVTLGPRGRNVVIKRGFEPEVVNDGVTIAREVKIDDGERSVGSKLLLQAAAKQDGRAGDGTTTATVLTQAIAKEGLRYVANGCNSVALQRGLIKASHFFAGKVRELATPVTTREQFNSIASMSCNDVPMGELLGEAFERVGVDGSTTVEDGQGISDTVEYTEGMEIEVGYLRQEFIKDVAQMTATLESPRVLVTDQKIVNLAEILTLLEGLVASKEPLLIIAPDVIGEAVSGLMLNKNRGVLDVCCVKCPGYGEVRRAFLEDICTLTGSNFITTDLSRKPEDATMDDLGTLERAVVTKEKTLLVGTGATLDKVNERVANLKNQIEEKIGTDKEYDIPRLEQRVVKLRGAVARILVGATTEVEIADRKLRYEDAINALTGAIIEGQVPGGGASLAYVTRFADEAREGLSEDEQVAVDVLIEAMGVPMCQVADNAGVLGQLVLEKCKGKPWGHGFNAKTLEYTDDLLGDGVCDPVSVTTWALENAASIAGSMLTTEAIITDIIRYDYEDLDYEPEFTVGMGAGAADLAW
jgi:chaperonin GroEL